MALQAGHSGEIKATTHTLSSSLSTFSLNAAASRCSFLSSIFPTDKFFVGALGMLGALGALGVLNADGAVGARTNDGAEADLGALTLEGALARAGSLTD